MIIKINTGFKVNGLIFWALALINLTLFDKSLFAQEFRLTSNIKSKQQLNGEWKFIWGELLSPVDFSKKESMAVTVRVPHSWKDDARSDYGVGTYRLNIRLAQKLENHSILFPIINSTAKIWVNGKLVDSMGVCSIDKKRYRAKFGSLLINVPSDTTAFELLVQVANFSYTFGGIVRMPQIGPTSILISEQNRRKGVDNFFVGSLVAMFIYHLILFFLYQRGKPNLFLALICLIVALRSMVTHGGSFLLIDLFPGVPMEFWKKLEFFGVYSLVAIFPAYCVYLFPQQASKKPIRFFIAAAVLLCGVVVFCSAEIYYRVLDVCHALLIAGIIYSLIVVIKAWKARNKDASTIFFGMLTSFPFVLLEILQNNQVIHFNFSAPYLVEIGVLVFLFFQIFLLANQYALAFKNLEQDNIILEERVKERTIELTKANLVQKKLLSVISHDIKGPMNSLRGVLNIYSTGNFSESETKLLISSIEENMNVTSMLMDNILHWTASQLKGIKVNYVKIDLRELVEEHYKIFKTIACSKNILLVNFVKQLEIQSDKQILSLVLRNLIANAIKFSFEGGRVEVSAHQADQNIIIQITDYGKGIPPENLDSIFYSATSKEGTCQEKGTGLGLTLCYDYLKHLNAQISVKSESGKGTTFTVRLPSLSD